MCSLIFLSTQVVNASNWMSIFSFFDFLYSFTALLTTIFYSHPHALPPLFCIHVQIMHSKLQYVHYATESQKNLLFCEVYEYFRDFHTTDILTHSLQPGHQYLCTLRAYANIDVIYVMNGNTGKKFSSINTKDAYLTYQHVT